MIEEFHLFGIFMPAALAWAIAAGVLVYVLLPLTRRLPLEALLWHRGLFDVALFLLLWWGIATLGDVQHLGGIGH